MCWTSVVDCDGNGLAVVARWAIVVVKICVVTASGTLSSQAIWWTTGGRAIHVLWIGLLELVGGAWHRKTHQVGQMFEVRNRRLEIRVKYVSASGRQGGKGAATLH